MSPRIAGKKFYDLGVDELNALVGKLESIIRKGGLKSLDQPKEQPARMQDVTWLLQLAQRQSSRPEMMS